MIIYCRLCAASYGVIGPEPVRCPTCNRETKWGTSPPPSQKEDPWSVPLSVNDKRMLRAMRIDPES